MRLVGEVQAGKTVRYQNKKKKKEKKNNKCSHQDLLKWDSPSKYHLRLFSSQQNPQLFSAKFSEFKFSFI